MSGDPAQPKDPARAARDQRRARSQRLSRLPWLYDYAERGRSQSVVAVLAQVVLAVVVVFVPLRLATGGWFPPGAGLLLAVVLLGMQAASRRANARAGRG